MDQAIKTIMEVIIRLIAVALFITGLIFAREFLHEKFDPARFRGQQTYPRASLPAPSETTQEIMVRDVDIFLTGSA